MLRFPSTDAAAGAVLLPTDAMWNAASGQAGGTALAAGDKVKLDRNVIFDLAGANLGESGPMKPRVAPTVTATGGGSSGGTLPAGTYRVAFAWVDSAGKESPESLFSGSFTVAAGNVPRVTIPAPPHPQIASYRLYLTNTSASLTSLTKYSSTDFPVLLGATSTVDMGAAPLGTGVTPENGAVRVTHVSARVRATGAWTLKGDLLDARSTGTGKVYVVDIADDACDGTFDSSAAAGKYENIYGVHFGVSGVRGGLRITGTVRSDPVSNFTRPRVKAAGEGSWRYSCFQNGTAQGDYAITDAEITSCADALTSKAVAVGELPTPPAITTIATSGGTAGTGTIPRSAINENYVAAYSYADANGNEGVRSPWSALFRPSASGAIPRLTLPEAIPAGVAYIHLFVIDVRKHKRTDPHPRYRAFIPVTVGQTPVVDVNASITRAVLGPFMSTWSGGEEMNVQRSRLRRCGKSGASGNCFASTIARDEFNWYRECLDIPFSWFSLGSITTGTKSIVGSYYDTLMQPDVTNPSGLTFGTAAEPNFVGNFAPVLSVNTAKLVDGNRAYNRCTMSLGTYFPGTMTRWRVAIDAQDWTNVTGSTPALSLDNWHGWQPPLGVLVAGFYNNIVDSAGADGTGDVFYANSQAPTGVTTWEYFNNFCGADLFDPYRRVGSIVCTPGTDTGTNRIRVWWRRNTTFLGTRGEPQMSQFNEASVTASCIQDFSWNAAYAPDFPTKAVLLADFHIGGFTTVPAVLHADFNAGFGLSVGTQTSLGNATVYAEQRSHDARDEAFADASALDVRGGLGPLRSDPGYRAFYRNDITMMWRDRGFALGSVRPSGTTVSDGAAKNSFVPADVDEFYAWLPTVWYQRPYVNADGSWPHVMDAIEFYRQWGTAPTNPQWAPALNGGQTPGWVDYVPLLTPASVVYRVRRRLTD